MASRSFPENGPSETGPMPSRSAAPMRKKIANATSATVAKLTRWMWWRRILKRLIRSTNRDFASPVSGPQARVRSGRILSTSNRGFLSHARIAHFPN